ncbi:MAG: hypothetical protein M1818_005545 [Claussenomyces sp. TS43310]|nr:MAG: hypothetical protein M1818_005545 [Claussenomyces sp. TS43310]
MEYGLHAKPRLDLPSYDASAARLPSLSPSRRTDRIVPKGLVAINVTHLQTTAGTSRSDMDRDVIPRRHEYSQGGYGRRTTRRFGWPASRSSNPFEDPEMPDSHSFSSPRTSHKRRPQASWFVSDSSTSIRTTASHGQLMSGGLGIEPDSATTPSAGLSKARSYNDVQVVSIQHNTPLLETSTSAGQLEDPSVASYCSAVSYPKEISAEASEVSERNSSDSQRSAVPFDDQNLCKRNSLRRTQSVKDLFSEYGIEFPVALGPSDGSTTDTSVPLQPTKADRRRHSCLWSNESAENTHERCGHVLCTKCAQSDITFARSELGNNADEAETRLMIQGLGQGVVAGGPPGPALSRDPHPGTEQIVQQDSPRPESIDKEVLERWGGLFHVPGEYSAPAKGSTSRGPLKRAPPSHISLPSSTSAEWSSPAASNVDDHVKSAGLGDNEARGSMFLELDSIVDSSSRSSPHEVTRNEFAGCDSPGCLATHAGHRPYRHSISCSRIRIQSTEAVSSPSTDDTITTHDPLIQRAELLHRRSSQKGPEYFPPMNDTEVFGRLRPDIPSSELRYLSPASSPQVQSHASEEPEDQNATRTYLSYSSYAAQDPPLTPSVILPESSRSTTIYDDDDIPLPLGLPPTSSPSLAPHSSASTSDEESGSTISTPRPQRKLQLSWLDDTGAEGTEPTYAKAERPNPVGQTYRQTGATGLVQRMQRRYSVSRARSHGLITSMPGHDHIQQITASSSTATNLNDDTLHNGPSPASWEPTSPLPPELPPQKVITVSQWSGDTAAESLAPTLPRPPLPPLPAYARARTRSKMSFRRLSAYLRERRHHGSTDLAEQRTHIAVDATGEKTRLVGPHSSSAVATDRPPTAHLSPDPARLSRRVPAPSLAPTASIAELTPGPSPWPASTVGTAAESEPRIVGLSIVIHLEGHEDLVVRAELKENGMG